MMNDTSKLEESTLLTIAIPTYNGARTIGNMLDILLPQINDQVEVLIVDNCSTDNTPQIVKKYMERYNKISYVRQEKNIGADGNFLYCMRMAKGKYIHLLSDDDVLTENSLSKIVDFLKNSPDMGLIYLGTANFYSHYNGKENCTAPIALPVENLCIKDKKIFMSYARHYWGFISSFIISREKFNQIKNPEQYFGTYWLQSYIHILCVKDRDTFLGVIKGICIAAGVYITQSNYDTSFVDGISYKRMLDFAVQYGFDKKQLDKLYIDRICLLASHGIIKEKATGNKKINKKQLFKCTYMYWKPWMHIYPMMLVPAWICRAYMRYYRRKKRVDYEMSLNREGDISTERIKNM